MFSPKAFLKISTLLLPKVNFKSTSEAILPVFPSNTISFGAEVYPFPNEDIPIESKDERESTLITCGIATLGTIVKSDGKSNPISLIFIDLILPIEVLEGCSIASDPIPDVKIPNVEISAIFTICGRE